MHQNDLCVTAKNFGTRSTNEALSFLIHWPSSCYCQETSSLADWPRHPLASAGTGNGIFGSRSFFSAVRSSDFDRAPADLITLFRMCQVAPFIAAASLMSERLRAEAGHCVSRLCSPVGRFCAGRRKSVSQHLTSWCLAPPSSACRW